VIAVLDSNSNPDGVTYPVPGNDDALRAIGMYCDLIADAVLDGIQAEMTASGTDIGESAEGPDYLSRLRRAGVHPEEVDYVFCTHMHVDHVGWNTHLKDGQWVPTFPHARYLFHQTEWEYWKTSTDDNQGQVMGDSVQPIIDAGLADMVSSDFVIEDGIYLAPTPGHTPGHCSVHLHSNGGHGIITGDMIHHPWQIAEPYRTSRACTNPEQAVQTRTEFVHKYADTATLILGTHFAPPTALHIVSQGDSLGVTY
jgi:glyoxylase-like metal-dependent hydrolase (beta-lactamase superfamily II)